MPKGKIIVKTEPVEPWQALTCFLCPKPAEYQQTAYDGERKLNASAFNCGDEDHADIAKHVVRKEGEFLLAQEMEMAHQ